MSELYHPAQKLRRCPGGAGIYFACLSRNWVLVSEMHAAVYFLGEQSGTHKGQVQLNVLMSFPLSIPLLSVQQDI